MNLKKYCLAFSLLLLFIACGSDPKKQAADTAPILPAAPNPNAGNPDYEKGLVLVAQSDCLTCHKIAEKFTGPSYQEVAAKYPSSEENINLLASKIIKGGAGVWGAIPMSPHPNITEADAKAMVKYILLLRK